MPFRKKLTAAALAAILLLSSAAVSPQVFAKTLNDLKKQQTELNQKYKTARDLLNETRSQMSAIELEIAELDAELDDVMTELDALSEDLGQTEILLKQTEEELSVAEASRQNQYEAMKERMKFLYEYGSISYLQVIFSSKSFHDLLTRIDFISAIVKYDKEMSDNLKTTEYVVASKLTEVENHKLEASLLKSQYEKQMISLATQLDERNAIISEMELDLKTQQEAVNEANAASAAVTKLIKDAEDKIKKDEAAKKAAATPKYNGKFGWPVQGYSGINGNYGWRTDPFNKKKKEFHNGMDLQAPLGTTIIASADGTVITAGYINGYGYTIIISHGGGVSTLYGHNSKLLVTAGTAVKKGQAIARAGSTGRSTGAHCHFEVRINGSHTNPWPYLK